MFFLEPWKENRYAAWGKYTVSFIFKEESVNYSEAAVLQRTN